MWYWVGTRLAETQSSILSSVFLNTGYQRQNNPTELYNTIQQSHRCPIFFWRKEVCNACQLHSVLESSCPQSPWKVTVGHVQITVWNLISCKTTTIFFTPPFPIGGTKMAAFMGAKNGFALWLILIHCRCRRGILTRRWSHNTTASFGLAVSWKVHEESLANNFHDWLASSVKY